MRMHTLLQYTARSVHPTCMQYVNR